MHEYLARHIHEEIEGAIDYLTKALEWKNKNLDVASKFFKMSDMEVEHANCMTKMFNMLEKSENISDLDFSNMQKSIIDDYTQNMNKIEHMKKLYWE